MGAPPSDTGLDQEIAAESLVTFSRVGLPGASAGTSQERKQNGIQLHCLSSSQDLQIRGAACSHLFSWGNTCKDTKSHSIIIVIVNRAKFSTHRMKVKNSNTSSNAIFFPFFVAYVLRCVGRSGNY